jgi:hypothetical protein
MVNLKFIILLLILGGPLFKELFGEIPLGNNKRPQPSHGQILTLLINEAFFLSIGNKIPHNTISSLKIKNIFFPFINWLLFLEEDSHSFRLGFEWECVENFVFYLFAVWD